MATSLGNTPLSGKVILTTGADWVCTLQLLDQSNVPVVWPAGTTCSITFPAQSKTFSAAVTVGTATAAFVAQASDVDTIPNGAKFRLYYVLPGSPTTEYAWFVGSVQRKDS